MTPEEKFNQDVWWTLQAIRAEHLSTPAGQNIKINTNRLAHRDPNSPPTDDVSKCIRKLQEWRVFRVIEKYDPDSYDVYEFDSDWDSATEFILAINQSKFDEIYKKYENSNSSQNKVEKSNEPWVKPIIRKIENGKLPYKKDGLFYSLWKYANAHRLVGKSLIAFTDLAPLEGNSRFAIFEFLNSLRELKIELEDITFHEDIYKKDCKTEYDYITEYIAKDPKADFSIAIKKLFKNQATSDEIFRILGKFDEFVKMKLQLNGLLEFVEFSPTPSEKNMEPLKKYLDAYIQCFIDDKLFSYELKNFYKFSRQKEIFLEQIENEVRNYGLKFVFTQGEVISERMFSSRGKDEAYLFIHTLTALEKQCFFEVESILITDMDVPPEKQSDDYKVKIIASEKLLDEYEKQKTEIKKVVDGGRLQQVKEPLHIVIDDVKKDIGIRGLEERIVLQKIKKQTRDNVLFLSQAGEILRLCNSLEDDRYSINTAAGRYCDCVILLKMIDTASTQPQGLGIIDEKYLTRFTKMTNAKMRRYAFNPDLEKDGYMPKVTIKNREGYSGWYADTFEIEGSAPKTLWGTNYFGVDASDYEEFINTQEAMLQSILNGYPITREHIERADLRTVAFCFNFVVSNVYGNLAEYLKKITFLDVGKIYKQTRNDIYSETETGFCVRFYNRQVSMKIYDKTAELINNPKKTQQEEALANAIKQGLVPFRILRLEVTLQNKTAVKKHLASRTDGDTRRERTLKEVFNNDLCQGILLHFFDDLTSKMNVQAIDTPLYPISEAFKRVRRAGMQPYDAYAFLGRALVTQQSGSLQLKLISDEHFMRQDRFRSDKRMQKLLALHPLPQFTLGKLFEECRKQLVEFKIMKPGDINLTSMPNTP